jgi:hypothetical protein
VTLLRDLKERLLTLAKQRLQPNDYAALQVEIKAPGTFVKWEGKLLQAAGLASALHSVDDYLFDIIDTWASKRNAPVIPSLPLHKAPPPVPAAAPASPADTLPDSAQQVQAPFSRADAQDAAILAEIVRLGYNPLALPRADAGKRGVKAPIREILTETRKDIFMSVNVFDEAWQRLRNNNQICDASTA